jgi:hypothetical protein
LHNFLEAQYGHHLGFFLSVILCSGLENSWLHVLHKKYMFLLDEIPIVSGDSLFFSGIQQEILKASSNSAKDFLKHVVAPLRNLFIVYI